MSSDVIIKVENLGKKYRIRHERERYTALRDVIAHKFAAPFRWLNGRKSEIGNSENLKSEMGTGKVGRGISAEPVSQEGQAERLSEDASPHQSLPISHSAFRTPRSEDFWALKDVSFEVKRGEVVGIIGRNGAGKSTLLKILSRITEPTTGRVELDGRVASLLEVGTGFHPELTGRENIFLNGAILGMTRVEIKKKFDEIVAFAEVEKFLDTPVKRYSSGMYVRLAFAVAAHLEPEILIVDEVLAVGDAEFQKKCLGKMQDVSKGGRTVLFVSHNMAAVQTLCANALLLEGGQLRDIGKVEAVVRHYLSALQRTDLREGESSLPLGKKLSLLSLSFARGGVISGEPAEFRVEFAASAPVWLREAAILIFSDFGTRVAVIDLRQVGVRDSLVETGGLVIEGKVHSMPLVEGDYRIGLYVMTDDHTDNYLDLATLSVGAHVKSEQIVPYPAVHRGHVELKFAARVHGPVVKASSS